MDIGFTGTRTELPKAQYDSLRFWLSVRKKAMPNIRARSGDCVGADKAFHGIAVELDWYTIGHIPNKDQFRAFCTYNEVTEPLPYLMRNRDIVDGSNIIVACPKEFDHQPKGGTWYTIDYARRIGKPLLIVYPDGTRVRNEVGLSWQT
jgi:hypothetical protein